MSLITDDVLDLLKFLDDGGIKWVIAGGYARDLKYGRMPKDLDIHIIMDLEAFLAIDNYLYKRKLGVPHGSGHMYEELDRVSGVLKMVGNVDLVFWKNVSTTQELVDNFDLNLNQYVYDVETGTVHFAGTNEGEVRITRPYEVNRIKRIQKMIGIAEGIGWECYALRKALIEQMDKYGVPVQQ